MDMSELKELLARRAGLMIELCADGTYRWECASGHGWDCESESDALAEFVAHCATN